MKRNICFALHGAFTAYVGYELQPSLYQLILIFIFLITSNFLILDMTKTHYGIK